VKVTVDTITCLDGVYSNSTRTPPAARSAAFLR